MAYLKIAQASVRVSTSNTGKVFPSNTIIRTPSLSVTAPKGNSGTIYLAFNATTPAGWNATRRETSLIPLTSGQSFTFGGIERDGTGIRDISFGTGISYILASATSQKAIITYYRWDG